MKSISKTKNKNIEEEIKFIKEQFRKAAQNFIGKPSTPDGMEKVEKTLQEILHKIYDSHTCIEVSEDQKIKLQIPQGKSLSAALYEYLKKITPTSWPTSYHLLKLTCAECLKETIYKDLSDIPEITGCYGKVCCPNCGYAWLTYEVEQ